jgi:hypothetical protein
MRPKTVGAEWCRTINEGDYNSTKITGTIYYSLDEEEDAEGCLQLAILECRDAVEGSAPKKHRRVTVKTTKYLAGMEIEEDGVN